MLSAFTADVLFACVLLSVGVVQCVTIRKKVTLPPLNSECMVTLTSEVCVVDVAYFDCCCTRHYCYHCW